MHFKAENGLIVYYNISYAANSTNGLATKYYRANITAFQVNKTALNSACNRVPRQCKLRYTNASYGCTNAAETIKGSPIIVFFTGFTLSNLSYWTEYDIRASACTCSGCGVFSAAVRVCTDEHEPTCSPNQVRVIHRTSTLLEFEWQPPLENCTNGYLTNYRVYIGVNANISNTIYRSINWLEYDRKKANHTYFRDTVNASSIFEGLEKNAEYCIVVAAVTSKGMGPATIPYCNSTLEDSEFFLRLEAPFLHFNSNFVRNTSTNGIDYLLRSLKFKFADAMQKHLAEFAL